MATLTTLDAELLATILENMSYTQILDWCNVNVRFSALCDDPSSVVGQLLASKRAQEVVATIDLGHDPTTRGSDFGIKITLSFDYGDFEARLFSTVEEARAMRQSIEDGRARVFATDPSEGQIMGIFYTGTTTDGRPTDKVEFTCRGQMTIAVHSDLFQGILEASLRAYDREIVTGVLEMFPDFSSRLLPL